jgi:putative spermidine/putrescine transport system permease protein
MRIALAQRIVVAILYAFLLAPIVITLLMSFSNDPVIGFPPDAWGLRAYVALAHNQEFIRTFGVSLAIASSVVGVCVAAGLPAGYAIAFHRFAGRELLLGLLTAPLLLPTIVIGLALLLLFVKLRLLATYPGLVIGHAVIALPYVVRLVVTAFRAIPADLADAAATLGAAPRQIALRVRLPLVRPAILAGAAIVFLVSFDEVVVSLFLIGPRLTTLPVEVFRHIDLRADPQVAALSAVLIALSLAIVLVLERTVGLARSLR